MKVFKIKTGNQETYHNFYDISNNKIIVDHLIQYENEIEIGSPVFLLFGGDSTPWENGLGGICKISSLPIDFGYETAKNGKYYKLELEIIIRLSRHFSKSDFIKYPETYDTGIGPSTKGERNQALGIIENTKAICAICRAIFDYEPDKKESLSKIFGNDYIEKATNETIVYFDSKLINQNVYGEYLAIPIKSLVENASEEELYKILGKALNEEYLKASKTNQAVAGIYYFGLMYRKIILDHNLNENKIIENAPDVKESFYYELNKAKNIYLYAKERGDIKKDIVNLEKKQENREYPSSSPHTPSQTIYYGVPGSGKSHKIDEITKSLPEEQMIRVVFHPEYTNADFVGQILPTLTEDGIEYRFKAGPFSRILKNAYQNSQSPYYLIIEEINRGNAAAIFGDLFQLLDRNSEGYSCYEIENLDINSFIRSKGSTYSDA